MAKTKTSAAKKNSAVNGKQQRAVVPFRKPPSKRWYNKKIRLWQAILMTWGAVWVFWIFWAVGYVQGQLN